METANAAANLAAIAAMALGLLNCFAGYRILRFLIALAGFVAGAAIGGAAGAAAARDGWVAAVGALAGGMIGASLAFALYIVGIFLGGACVGALVGAFLCAAGGDAPVPAFVVLLAIIGGIAAVALSKLVVILTTSFGGALWAVLGAAFIAGGPALARHPGNAGVLAVAAWLVLGVAGVIVQYRTDGDEPREARSGRKVLSFRNRRATIVPARRCRPSPA